MKSKFAITVGITALPVTKASSLELRGGDFRQTSPSTCS